MSKQLIEYQLDDGSIIYIESNFQEKELEPSSGIERINAGPRGLDPCVRAANKFNEVVGTLKPVAETLLSTLKELNTPKEIQLEFGVNLSAKAGIVIASADSSVNFKVTLKWENSDG